MKVVIFGASGIIGQHLRLTCPDAIGPIYVRRTADHLHRGLDLTDREAREEFLGRERPAVIINLAGESNTDVVERDHGRHYDLNAVVPGELARWCDDNSAHLIHASTQVVFAGVGLISGDDAPPYTSNSRMGTINAYGDQKKIAERRVGKFKNFTIVRPTFVLGIRPLPHVGRQNPAEQILGGQVPQVSDRWFSTSFARDVARGIWHIAQYGSEEKIVHLGNPNRTSRYELGKAFGMDVLPVSHSDFPNLAERPIDTSYADSGTRYFTRVEDGINQLKAEWQGRKTMDVAHRAREIAMFLGIREEEAFSRLSRGFGHQHAEVTADWKRANPETDEQILEWYRRTEAYIWELSAYHADPGFNYGGMCQGISERLKAAGAKKVLCLGDGIGDLTISLIQAGFDATYHDLTASRTEEFAAFRSWMYLGKLMPMRTTTGWVPHIGLQEWDAIVALDFLEHVINVEQWAAAIKAALKPDGLFCAQNAFAIGSGSDGSMPMHLARNDRFEKEWDSTLSAMGFAQESSNWYSIRVLGKGVKVGYEEGAVAV